MAEAQSSDRRQGKALTEMDLAAAQQLMQLSDEDNNNNNNSNINDNSVSSSNSGSKTNYNKQDYYYDGDDDDEVGQGRPVMNMSAIAWEKKIEEIFGKEKEEAGPNKKRRRYRSLASIYSTTKPVLNIIGMSWSYGKKVRTSSLTGKAKWGNN